MIYENPALSLSLKTPQEDVIDHGAGERYTEGREIRPIKRHSFNVVPPWRDRQGSEVDSRHPHKTPASIQCILTHTSTTYTTDRANPRAAAGVRPTPPPAAASPTRRRRRWRSTRTLGALGPMPARRGTMGPTGRRSRTRARIRGFDFD